MRRFVLISLVLGASVLAGCGLVGESEEKILAAKEAEGKAIGGACRHAGRAIEDCYALNKKADKASVFAGWRDMNDYMRENKIEAVAPQLGTGRIEAKSGEAKGAEKLGEKSAEKSAESKVVDAKAEVKGGNAAEAPAEDKHSSKAGARKGQEAKGHDS